MFTPILGEMIQFDEHFFQTGLVEHQVDNYQYTGNSEMIRDWIVSDRENVSLFMSS